MRHGQTSDLMHTILCMKTLITPLALLLFLSLAACKHKTHVNDEASAEHGGSTGPKYKYSDLVIRDYDEMYREVQIRLKKAQNLQREGGEGNDGEAIEELRDALRLILSRPNSDNMVAKLMPDVRRELGGMSAFEDTLSSLAAECLASVKNENSTVARRSTDLFILENMLTEIRPEIGRNEDMLRIVRRIADANITIDSEVWKDRKIRSMFKTINPSDQAKEMLKAIGKDKEPKKK